ncbi:MAG: carboxypeptidase-like regulatory domain-containing protein [Lachnospiraceae bacterium]|nr:carboxypeptidase-like regulatory domain-containing protein [Lachnospiraceae bacterium]
MLNSRKNKILSRIMAVLLTVMIISGCGKNGEKIVTNKDDAIRSSTEASETSLPSLESDDIGEPDEDDGHENGEVSTGHEEDAAISDSFEEGVAFINRSGGVLPEIDYETVKYEPAERDSELPVNKKAPKEIEQRLNDDKVKTVRLHRSGNGATIDFTVYTNPEDRLIEKIVSTEYGSEGREVTGFYYKNGVLLYTYRYMDDLYGINKDDARKSGGQRCYFLNDFLSECYATYGENNESVTAATYDDMNPDIQKEYDELEAELINRAYVNYDVLRSIPSTAKIYGYVSDEYGGTLANTKVTIKSEANGYESSVTTNGDGYYEFAVPVNTADWYNMVFEYGDFAPSMVNDIYIRPRTIEYPIGVTYMSPEGEEQHDKDVYLLDVTKQSPDKLKENQYEVVLTYNTEKIPELIPFTLDLNSGRYENNLSQIITVDSSTDYKYFVTDQVNGKKGNNMSNDMSLSEAQVKVYNKNGLVGSFQAPVGHSGVVWEVFEIKGSEIIPSNNYYFETGKNIFF